VRHALAALLDVEGGHFGDARVLVDTDVRIRLGVLTAVLLEHIGESHEVRVGMSLEYFQLQGWRAGDSGHEGIVSRDLVRQQQLQLAIDLLLQVLQPFQLRSASQPSWFAE
jgi:hypothetical protein